MGGFLQRTVRPQGDSREVDVKQTVEITGLYNVCKRIKLQIDYFLVCGQEWTMDGYFQMKKRRLLKL